jgi:hypothetical protein
MGNRRQRERDGAGRGAGGGTLAFIFVDRFQSSDDAAENLLALRKVSVWRQGTFILNGGWGSDARR